MKKQYAELEKVILAKMKEAKKGVLDWKIGFEKTKKNKAIMEIARRLADK